MATSITKLNTVPEITKLNSFIWFISLMLPLLYFISRAGYHLFWFHAGLFSIGWISWTYTEYFFHRFIMHETGKKTKIGILLNHSHHHHDPHDIRVSGTHRLLMVIGSMILVSLAILLNNYFTLFCGYFFGFTFYSMLHLFLHYQWSAKVFPQLHRFHIHHHCKHPDKCFGVTVTWWDHLFGTVPMFNTEISGKVLAFYYKKECRTTKPPLANRIEERLINNVMGGNQDDSQELKTPHHSCTNCGKAFCNSRNRRTTY